MSENCHLLSFATDRTGSMVSVHADLAGVRYLISQLEEIRDLLIENDCPHTHLFSGAQNSGELTTTKLTDHRDEVTVVSHVKIYGWNAEWAVKHGLKGSENKAGVDEDRG